jgi:hypothetical protein
MDRHQGALTALIISLLVSLYLAIVMDLYEGPQTSLNIALLGGLYLDIKMDRQKARNCRYSSLAWRPLLRHYDGPV